MADLARYGFAEPFNVEAEWSVPVDLDLLE